MGRRTRKFLGNFIGTDRTGTNSEFSGPFVRFGMRTGVELVNEIGQFTRIGGSDFGQGNVISGNEIGVDIGHQQLPGVITHISGNKIGTSADGTSPLGNTKSGISSSRTAEHGGTPGRVLIGGETLAEANVIAFNGTPNTFATGGIVLADNTAAFPFPARTGEDGIDIQGNVIHSNMGLGIDLGDGGVNLNDDFVDLDSGPNGLQNYPAIKRASAQESDMTLLRIAGRLVTSTGQFRIDLYWNQTCDESHHGESERYLGSFTVDVPILGESVAFDRMVQLSFAAEYGQFVVATATDSAGRTSEFGECVPITAKTGFSTLVDEGAEVIEVNSTTSLDPTDQLLLSSGGANEETVVVSSVAPAQDGVRVPGTLVLASPLQFAHMAGEDVIELPPPGLQYLWGDADCGGAVDPNDALVVLREAAALSSSRCVSSADITCDGTYSPADAVAVLRHLAGFVVQAPPPCPAIGSPRPS